MRGGTTTKVDFRDAGRHEHELNERQREVLALVASGLTNGEIGERLGMTLDGAKWNVSEILTKLGLASREEAADYWRWRHGGVWSRVRGWLGAPLLKVAGAGAAVMVGVGVVAALMSEDEAAVVDEPGRPFYLEAEIRVSSNARTIGTNIAGPTPMADPDESRSVMRWAWRDADHYRFEIETTEPAIDAGSFLVVADGSRLWFHNEQEATYAEQELWPLPPGFRFRPVGISVMLGPVPFPGDVDTVDELTAAIEQWRPDDKDWVRMAGDDRMLGRAVVVIEMGPARCSSTQTWDADGSTTSAEECDGSSRLWVDPETMVILRHFVQSSTQSFDGVVTRLDYDTTLDDSLFAFTPPPGATREEEGSSDSSSGSVTLSPDGENPPSGFLRLVMVPRGYASRGVSGGDSSFDQEFRGPNELGFTVSQRKRAMPEALKVGEEHESRGLKRYSTTLENGWTRLAWEEAGVTVVLEAESMPVEQLLAIAGSMKVVE